MKRVSPPRSFTGGCRCGAIRYRCTAAGSEIQMFKCHCRDCQQFSGGPFAAVVFVPAGTFEFTKGRPRYFTVRGAAGLHRRGFCVRCGSRLTGGEKPRGRNDHLGVTAGSLDDPSWFRAQAELWKKNLQPWDKLEKGIPHFAGNPV